MSLSLNYCNKRKITFKLLTAGDEKAIDKEIGFTKDG